MNFSLPNWLKAVLIGGIVAVAAFITDNKDFSLSNWPHLLEAFLGGALSALLLLLKGFSSTPPLPPPSK